MATKKRNHHPIVKRLRKYKDAKGLTLKELADDIEFSYDALIKWFYTDNAPGPKSRKILAYFLSDKGF